MRAPIVRLFGVIALLFALLIGWTSRWTVFEAKSLNDNPLNKRTLFDELRIKRGRILAADGTVLARSVAGPDGTWTRAYPTGGLFAQPVGYSIALLGSAAGIERSRGDALRGLQSGIGSVLGQLSPHPVGDDVYTTLDPNAQRTALQQLGGQAGSVVALDPRTGAIKVMISIPGYDDNHPFAHGPSVSTFNRATQAGYPPGSTFKVVTATAAIDSGRYSPSSSVDGSSPVTISGVPLNNDNNQSFGSIDLTTALTYSVNTVWAQVAEHVGQRRRRALVGHVEKAHVRHHLELFAGEVQRRADAADGEHQADRPAVDGRGKMAQQHRHESGEDRSEHEAGREHQGHGLRRVPADQVRRHPNTAFGHGNLPSPDPAGLPGSIELQFSLSDGRPAEWSVLIIRGSCLR